MGLLIRGAAAQAQAVYGSPGLTPDAVGYKDWNVPPWACGSNTGALTPGTIYGLKVPTRGLLGADLAAVAFQVGTVGATLSGSKIGVYDIPAGSTAGTGTKLGEASADAAFLSATWNEVALAIENASLTQYVFVALLPIGTTGPILLRTPNSTANQLAMGQANKNTMPTCLLGGLTGQASLPSTINYANNSANSFVNSICLR